jgi:chromosomal replication initiator protein
MTNQQLWQAVLGELELLLSRANFTTWFKNTSIIDKDNGRVIVGVPNTFTKTWLEKKYHQAIVSAMQNVVPDQVTEVIYKVEVRSIPINQTGLPVTHQIPVVIQQPTGRSTSAALKTGYRFENFIVGKGSELAHAAAQAVAANPGQSYNPLFIYGGVGLGKTHLLQAIGWSLKDAGRAVLYVTSEGFTNDYIQSIRAGRAKEFKDQYRNVDVLLIDDIQFIAGKEGTQEEFFHTFNELHQNNKQIVLTSDRPPKAIPALEARLLSRFEWGMIGEVTMPDMETRTAILQAKCRERGLNIDPDVIHYLATYIQNNIRELEGALNRIVAELQFNRAEITVDYVKKLFTSLDAAMPRRSVSPKQIMELVCRYYDITNEDLCGKSRKRELVVPRQIIMYLMREETRSSFPTIGEEIGKRDHTTVMHAYEKIRLAFENNEQIRQDILYLRQQLSV